MKIYTASSTFASLAGLGSYLHRIGLWKHVEEHVSIRQKTIRHRPTDKLLDAFITILTGAGTLCEVNLRLRPDPALSRAFGRSACAEQSTISDTLDACSAENVEQLRQALSTVLRQHGRAYRHDYERALQVLDVDMSGLVCGTQAEGAAGGYFAGRKGRRGRQLGRVLATHYGEVVTDRLYAGTVQLERSLQELVSEAEAVLDLDEGKRARTLVRADGGAGSDQDIDFLLERHYQLLVKVKNWKRVETLHRSVRIWHEDPSCPGREIGWVEAPHAYARATRQVGTRQRTKEGRWVRRVLVTTLWDEELAVLAGLPYKRESGALEQLLLVVRAYDRRGGGVETSFKQSKQGLGLSRRNKRRFSAQEMLVLLAQLAHNLLIWFASRLSEADRRLRGYGVLRLVRDVLRIGGRIAWDERDEIRCITLNERHSLAAPLAHALAQCIPRHNVLIVLGKI